MSNRCVRPVPVSSPSCREGRDLHLLARTPGRRGLSRPGAASCMSAGCCVWVPARCRDVWSILAAKLACRRGGGGLYRGQPARANVHARIWRVEGPPCMHVDVAGACMWYRTCTVCNIREGCGRQPQFTTPPHARAIAAPHAEPAAMLCCCRCWRGMSMSSMREGFLPRRHTHQPAAAAPVGPRPGPGPGCALQRPCSRAGGHMRRPRHTPPPPPTHPLSPAWCMACPCLSPVSDLVRGQGTAMLISSHSRVCMLHTAWHGASARQVLRGEDMMTTL